MNEPPPTPAGPPKPAADQVEVTPEVRNALTNPDPHKQFYYDIAQNGVFAVAQSKGPNAASVEGYALNPRFVKLDKVPRDVQRQWMQEATARVAASLPEEVAGQLTFSTNIASNEARFQALRILEPSSDAARRWSHAFDARLREYLTGLAVRANVPPQRLFRAKQLATAPELPRPDGGTGGQQGRVPPAPAPRWGRGPDPKNRRR